MTGPYWIIFTIIFSMCSAWDILRCLPQWKCNCCIDLKKTMHLHCPTGKNSSFVMKIEPKNRIIIECKNDPQWFQFQLLNLFLEDDMMSMKIQKCDLPMNSSISESVNTFSVENINQLELYNVNTIIVRNHLKGFPKLRELSLINTGLTNLNVDVFTDVPHLFKLVLKGGSVSFPLGVFNNTPELDKLELSDNMFVHIDPSIFDPLTKLQYLILRNNNFTELRPGMFDKLVSLSTLDLSRSNLTSLPKNIFSNLKNLRKLTLKYNNFSSLPEDLLKYNYQLEYIFIEYNTRDITLPKKFFANLTSLQYISLYEFSPNGRSTIPEDLFWGSISLKSILILNNYFETLPKRIFEGLHYLEYLDLKSNKLITLPDGIFSDTSSLIYLRLANNYLTSISRNLFSNLTQLVLLDLQRNQLQEIEDSSFSTLKNLEFAFFSYNQLTFSSLMKNKYKNKSPFYNCTSLTKLHLDNNNISQIFEDWVNDCTQLQMLNLSYNKISHISAEDLQFTSNCVIVDLQYNEIQHINMTRAEEIAKYYDTVCARILVNHNPIICDCNLYDFIRYLEGKMHPYVQNYFIIDPGYDSICYGPDQMYNVSVYSLKSKSSKYLNSELRVKQCFCREYEMDRTFVVDCAYKDLADVGIPWESALSHRRPLVPGMFQKVFNISDIPMYELAPCHRQRRSYFNIFHKIPGNICDLSLNWSLGDFASEVGRKDVKKLLFEPFGNLCTILTRNHLKGFPNLYQLILSSNGITHLSSDIFADVPHLVMLHLRNNSIRLAPGIFNTVQELEVLDLSNNMMHGIEPDIFDKLVSLMSLDLSSNNLNTLPENIFAKAEKMKELKLDNNSFNSLPAYLLKHNTKLKRITLCNNRNDMTLPETFFANLTELEELKLKHNGWIMLPKNIFRSLTALENFNLGRNNLFSLDKSVFQELRRLLVLDLSYNKLSTLPDEIFFHTIRLTHLNLAGNRFTIISRTLFKNLQSLRILNMERNQLQMPKDMKFTTEKFWLQWKSLITTFFESPFYDCSSLEELHLAKNNISDLFYNWLSFKSDLRLLDLSHNNIHYLSIKNLTSLRSNISLDLRHNKIKHIHLVKKHEIMFFEASEKNIKILIANNPIVCDCTLYDFLYYLDERRRPSFQQFFHIIPENLTCHGPEWTTGTVVNQLRWNSFKCSKTESCPTECSCWLKPNNRVFLVDCSNKNLTMVPTNIRTIPSYRLEINLMGNQFIKIPLLTEINSNNTLIFKLRLANNNISDVSVKDLTLNVEVLELHNNSIKRFKSEVVQYLRSSIIPKTLTLHGNPWTCDCDSKDFLDFVQSQTPKRILNLSMIECKNIKIPILKIRMEDLCPNNVMVFVGASFVVIITALIISTVIALYYRYQREIKVWLYAHESCLWLVTEDELDKDKPYDAFISYSHKDEDFVVNELIPKLESGPRPFKLCVHFRNWLAGEYIPTQIARSIENSRRTIVILSTNFINSIWGRMEFKAAHCQALSEGRTRVILILYGEINVADHLDPDLKAYLNMHTYIKWGDPWFWDKLRYALPHCPELQNNYNYQEAVSESFALDVIGQ